MQKYCPDCHKKITRQANHCASCSGKRKIKLSDSDTLKLDVARFKSKIIIHESGCWFLKGQESKDGYAYVAIRQKYLGAHRAALFIFKGLDLNTPLDAMHSCDNTLCVNPGHLQYGTRIENMRDAAKKGRIVNQYGPC
jgi:DnaJ-class molecular chaperone